MTHPASHDGHRPQPLRAGVLVLDDSQSVAACETTKDLLYFYRACGLDSGAVAVIDRPQWGQAWRVPLN